MITLYFTATGNCLEVARAIGGELVSIPRAMDEDRYEFRDDAVGIVFPVYYGYVPKIVRQFLDLARIEADYRFAIGTYGNAPGDAIASFARIEEDNGRPLDYTATIRMVDTLVDLFDPKKEQKKLGKKGTEARIKEVAEAVNARKKGLEKPPMGSKAVGLAMKGAVDRMDSGLTAQDRFVVSDKCNSCGTCSKVCPTGNVTAYLRPSFGINCENCYACLHNCPRGAIHLRVEASSNRFRNPSVTLEDIIDANRRKLGRR